jgi:hypothetical protein
MIRGVLRQHDGSSRRLAWYLGTAVFDNLAVDIDEMASLHFLEFTLEMLRIGCLEEWSSDELTKFVQLMIAWLTRGSQGDSCVTILQVDAMSRECLTSSKQARERFAWRGFADDVGGDMGECTIWHQNRSEHTHSTGLM